MTQNKTLLIVAAVLLGLPILSCGGCLMLGMVVSTIDPTILEETAPVAPDVKQPRIAPVQAIKQVNAERLLENYIARLSAVGIESSLIDYYKIPDEEATTMEITVSQSWHYQPKAIRLQMAQLLWEIWAKLRFPKEPDSARLELVDGGGNSVGGSGWLGGSLISVTD